MYGTGGLGLLKAEITSEPQTRGAVSAVLQPGKPDSGGAQFFVSVTDQPSLGGKYSVFGRVAEGMDVVQKISETPATPEGMTTERVEILGVEIRDTPPPEPEAFSTEPDEALARRAILDVGRPDYDANPSLEGARPCARLSGLAAAGVWWTSFIGWSRVCSSRLDSAPRSVTDNQQKIVAEFQPKSTTPPVRDRAMARRDDPPWPTSFFIGTGTAARSTDIHRVRAGRGWIAAFSAIGRPLSPARSRFTIS